MARRSVFELSRALQFFADSSFLTVNQAATGQPLHYSYGACGALLLQNFTSAWCNENVAAKEKVSMISTSIFADPINDLSPRESLSPGCQLFYGNHLSSHNNKLPFGIAASGTCVSSSDEMTVLGMQRPRESIECLIQYFVPEKLVSDTFHRLEFDHLMWWKKLSNSKDFSSQRLYGEEMTNTSSHIVYSSCHDDTTVESIAVTGPHTELALCPYVIESKISTDVAILVLLHDAYTESNDTQTQALRFDKRLAPYKLGILFDGEDTDSLSIIADFIKEELRKEAILIQTDQASSDHTRLQQLGVSYVVHLTDKTIEDGTVNLQNLSAATMEMVHATKLKDLIVRFVKSV